MKTIQSVAEQWRKAPQTSNSVFRWRVPTDYAKQLLTVAHHRIVQSRGREYKDEPFVTRTIERLAELLTSTDPSTPKGAYLCGLCGTGKTTLLYAIRNATNFLIDHNPRYVTTEGMHIRSARDLAKLEPYEMRLLYDHPCVAIDDLGEEPVEVMSYGNVSTPIVDIIEHRYNNNLPTFITTNLTSPERYGRRVCDRLNEMMVIMVVGDEGKVEQSFRKN